MTLCVHWVVLTGQREIGVSRIATMLALRGLAMSGRSRLASTFPYYAYLYYRK